MVSSAQAGRKSRSSLELKLKPFPVDQRVYQVFEDAQTY